MTRQFSFEITEAWPLQVLIQVHLGDDHRAPRICFRHWLAFVIPHSGEHPISLRSLIGAADEIHLVFASARACEEWIATPHRPRDDFGASVCQFAGDLGEE